MYKRPDYPLSVALPEAWEQYINYIENINIELEARLKKERDTYYLQQSVIQDQKDYIIELEDINIHARGLLCQLIDVMKSEKEKMIPVDYLLLIIKIINKTLCGKLDKENQT